VYADGTVTVNPLASVTVSPLPGMVAVLQTVVSFQLPVFVLVIAATF
jgi:hypothetical protein